MVCPGQLHIACRACCLAGTARGGWGPPARACVGANVLQLADTARWAGQGKLSEQVGGSAGSTYDQAKGGAGSTYDQAKGSVGSTYDQAKGSAGSTYDQAKGTAGSSYGSGSGGNTYGSGSGGSMVDQAKDYAGSTYESAKGSAQSAYDSAKGSGGTTYGSGGGSGASMADQAKDYGSSAYGSARDTGASVLDGAQGRGPASGSYQGGTKFDPSVRPPARAPELTRAWPAQVGLAAPGGGEQVSAASCRGGSRCPSHCSSSAARRQAPKRDEAGRSPSAPAQSVRDSARRLSLHGSGSAWAGLVPALGQARAGLGQRVSSLAAWVQAAGGASAAVSADRGLCAGQDRPLR